MHAMYLVLSCVVALSCVFCFNLQSIRVSHNDRVDECFVAMLEAWFKKGSPSWSVIVEALRGRGVEGGALANNIERTFMNTYYS